MLSHHTLHALLDHLQDSVFIIEGGRFSFVNNQAAQLLGYTREAILDRPFTNFIHEDDRQLVLQRYTSRRRGEATPSEYTFRVVCKNGQVRDVRMRVGNVVDESGELVSLGSLQDITEQKQTRLALKHSQDDIASLLNNMTDVFYRTDMQGVITFVSPATEQSIGYTPEEMIGRKLSDFYYYPEDREKVIQALIKAEGRAIQIESQLRHRDGNPIWVSTNAYLRLDCDTSPACIEGIARDITERKQMERRLKELAKKAGLEP
ncbi:MAG: PAS domain-containing protein [Pseudomonadota bacterium]